MVTRALNSKEIPTVKALRQLAKERRLKGYSELNKVKLLKQLKVELIKIRIVLIKIARTGGGT